MSKQEETILQTVGLSALTGIGSMSGPALLARYAGEHPDRFKRTFARWLTSDAAQRLFPLAAIGEMVADKLPILPKRKSPGPLIGRIFWGGFAGAALYAARRESPAAGAAIGGVTASVSTFVTYYIRKFLNKSLRLPSPVAGLVEDVFIVKVGPRILK